MRISVVIPTYNRSVLLKRTLDTVLAQTRPADEILVVDDGSTDDTQAAATEAAYIEAGVKYVYQENTNQAGARSNGQQRVTGDAILFLDSDDLLLPDAIGRLEESLDANTEAIVAYGDAEAIGYDEGYVRDDWQNEPHEGNTVWWHLIERNFIRTPGCALIRRAPLERVGLWDRALKGNEDWDMWLRLAEMGSFVHLSGTPVLRYRVHGASTSANLPEMGRTALLLYAKHARRNAGDPARQQHIEARWRQSREGLAACSFEWTNQAKGLWKGGERQKALRLLRRSLEVNPMGVFCYLFHLMPVYERMRRGDTVVL